MRALTSELIKLSEQTRTAHDVAIDHEEWAVAEELRTLASAIAALIAKTLRGELAGPDIEAIRMGEA